MTDQTSGMDEIVVGQRRRTPMGRIFTVMRINSLVPEALLRFDDKTTDWWELAWVRSDSSVIQPQRTEETS